jgi:hypothetical protein
MPILAAETSEFPDNLLTQTSDVAVARRWWAVYTKPRQEKSLARELVRLEVPFYLPLVKKANVIRQKSVVSQLPLFDGYLFLYGDDEERVRALSTHRIAQLVAVSNYERLHSDLLRIRQLIASDAPLTIERRLLPGRRVRIRAGAMRGLEGTIVVRRGQTRLLVAIDFLQQGATVAIEDYQLEPLD